MTDADMVSIEVDHEVYEHLKERSTFEDTPNTVLRRELGLDDVIETGSPSAQTPHPEPAARAPARKRQPKKTKRTRVPSGMLLPATEYELPILRVLDECGGEATKSDVIEKVGDLVRDRLTPLDHEHLSSGEIRWENRVQFARMHLAKDGLLSNDAPRGIWAITDDGRKRLQAQ